jgi:uncharacterized repeat protein (TIGR01451 family)
VYAITASGDTVSNSATVNFSVNSVAQSPITSVAHTFIVDTKIDLTVTKIADDNVNPNATLQPLEFTVTNDGNAIQDFLLSTENSAGDDFDPSSTAIYVEDGTTVGFQSAEDTLISTLDNLAVGASQTVYLVSTIPGTPTGGQTSVVYLKAEARASADGSALTEDSDGDNKDAAEIVFAAAAGVATGDNADDQFHSAAGTYTVLAASLSVSKTSTVIDDGAGGLYRIPGATVEYTITVSNGAGAETATGITVTDLLDTTRLTYVPGSLKVTAPNLYSGVQTTLTDTNGDDEGDYNITSGNTVTVTGISLLATESATVVFRVLIQ